MKTIHHPIYRSRDAPFFVDYKNSNQQKPNNQNHTTPTLKQ